MLIKVLFLLLFFSHINKKKLIVCRTRSPTPSKSFKETLSEKMPQSMKTEVLVKVKNEDPNEVLKERQQLVRTTSPSRLAQITSFSDIPVPSVFSKSKR